MTEDHPEQARYAEGAMKPIRVLMISRLFYPWIGGTERQVQKLSQALMAQGAVVRVVTGWWFQGTPQQEVIDGIPVYRNFTMWEMFGIKGLRKFGAYMYLITLLAYLWWHRREYDVIHVHLLNYHAFAAVLAGKWFNKKTIIKIANSGPYSDIARMERNELIPGTRRMLPLIFQADRIVALSRLMVEELQSAGIPAERIVGIPNGVEVSSIPARLDYRLHEPVTVIFVGRLHPQKGVEVLLPAFQQAAVARPGFRWRLLLLGDGPSRSSLEAVAREYGENSPVLFCGEVSDIHSYLAQADIFVLPSQAEGMSNALLEAMSHGLPCIASRIGGNSELIKDGYNGRLVDCSRVEELSRVIIELVDSSDHRERLGRAARRTIETDFNIESVAARYINLYQALTETERIPA